MKPRYLLISIILAVCIIVSSQNQAQEKPHWRFSVLASVSDKTAAFYGGLDSVKTLIRAQFKAVNQNYNDPNVFDGTVEFVVDSFITFEGSTSQQYYTPRKGCDYQILYDMFGPPRANWIASPSNTLLLQIPWAEGYPEIFSSTFVKVITHEFGHARGAVDLYGLVVVEKFNQVNAEAFELPASVMTSRSQTVWSEHTINVINYHGDHILDSDETGVQTFFAKQLGVLLLDPYGIPIRNATISFYSHSWYNYDLNEEPFEIGVTDTDGSYHFKQNPYLNQTQDYNYIVMFGLANSTLLAVFEDGLGRPFFWLPFTMYQNDYFRGNTDTSLIVLQTKRNSRTPELKISDYISLRQNYPNPFNGQTTINLNLLIAANIEVRVFNILGQEVASLYKGSAPAGELNLAWDGTVAGGKQAASGFYYYCVSAGGQRLTKTMLHLK